MPRSRQPARPLLLSGALAGAGLVGLVAVRLARRRTAGAQADALPSHIELPDDLTPDVRAAILEGIEIADQLTTSGEKATTPGWIRVSAGPAVSAPIGLDGDPRVVAPA